MNKALIRKVWLGILFTFSVNLVMSQIAPFVGAQVFIEPGQKEEDIDLWFRRMKENKLTVCRVLMFEIYMHDGSGNWDFGLFDKAFMAAEKYGVNVYASVFPASNKSEISGFKFPRSNEHLASISEYIKQVATHFKKFKSLYGWVLINEPGVGGKIPGFEYSQRMYADWKKDHPSVSRTDNGYPLLIDFSEELFLLQYETWFLKWVAEEIMKYDSAHEIHVNNHNIFYNCAEYDFPNWRKFLTSLGGSAHASWHFSYFTRKQYAVAMSANCEMLYSGAGSLPWFMTELQGGNNTYSGIDPMCPTKDEISQWLWIIYGTKGAGGIFWTLNARSSGLESGEWALLDFYDDPSDRLLSAKKVMETVEANGDLFTQSSKVDSHINVLYVRESMWAERRMIKHESAEPGRMEGAVIKSALGYFEALTELGVSPNFMCIDEYDFSKENFKGETIILAHQLSLPKRFSGNLEAFVSKGGKLIVDGLTAFFNEQMENTMNTNFDYEKLFGGKVKEYKLVDRLFTVEVEGIKISSHLWKGIPFAKTGSLIYDKDSVPIAIRNKMGKGEVLWVPALLGLGSRMENNFESLDDLLIKECAESLDGIPVRFEDHHKNVLMKTLQHRGSLVTIMVNKNESTQNIKLRFLRKGMSPKIIYSNRSAVNGNSVELSPEDTCVVLWR